MFVLAEGIPYCLIHGKLLVNTHPIEFSEQFDPITLLSLHMPLAYFKEKPGSLNARFCLNN